ncbi:DNA methyltransferase [Salegentibacter salinarum]|uniref:DNA (cytosine-5-)-methyltransferase n=1 Tax=Salegentibacter salinarum TaxID=447422 RepID=A0A2N0TSE7_9FLAO|nr:DNA (cytosine-5-)-methyltransferase [Salegentibacter salinarum]PKD17662.1 DNA methyltransferase [Salegentibacter salinarum]SKB50622.1 DNA (cytosine-5)-methyltransferase 1 [Salegentibacter salinarum]
MSIPVIDIFAGPGGLGEGFSSIFENGERVFDIKLSIEKNEHAHQTLLLRSFYRKFPLGKIPDLYYDYIKENNRKKQQDILASLRKNYEEEWKMAEDEAWNFELPYPEEFDEKGNKKGGYTEKEIKDRHEKIDIRISDALSENEKFLLIGGPPCQAYSLVGRSRNQGISDGDHRVHLYKEYLRIIAKHHPAVFVMENVKGLLSAAIDGKKVFDLIKKDLRYLNTIFEGIESPEYCVYSFVKKPDSTDENGFPVYNADLDYLIRSENFGIPQKRHRVILLGIQKDLIPEELQILQESEEITLDQVIGSLPKIRSGVSREIVGLNEKEKNIYSKIKNSLDNWKGIIHEYLNKFDEPIKNEFEELLDIDYQGASYFKIELEEENNSLFKPWYYDKNLSGVLNHESRTHLKEDLGRYLFSSLYLKANGEFPRLKDYPDWLLPEHKNARDGDKFVDRFRTQKPDVAATTVTSHISKDGHYFIHYDSSQCRSLTVREAARIQTFPDNYYFCGSRTHQYHQVGNAVPPFLANKLAVIVYNIFQQFQDQ